MVPTTPAMTTPASTEPKTTIKFNELEFDFGTIKQGDIKVHDFVFRNTGKEAFRIASATGSCGCTVPKYPQEPIGVGQEGTINVQFNSTGKMGMQTKTVTINGNSDPAPIRLIIKANILSAEQFAAYETAPQIEKATAEHDFGMAKEGKKLRYTYTIKNTGKTPLMVESVKAGDENQVRIVQSPIKAIAPGKSGKVKLEWNTANLRGDNTQYVTIMGNTVPARHHLGSQSQCDSFYYVANYEQVVFRHRIKLNSE